MWGICLVSQKLLASQELCFMESVSMHYSDTRLATTWQPQGAGEITVSSLRAQQADVNDVLKHLVRRLTTT